MTPTLHQTDEEADSGAYHAYLRAQSDADLLDIARHLDPNLYPARADAARREMRRRHVLHVPVYTVAEYAVRYISVIAFTLAALTLLLAALLSEHDALGPTWPSGDALPDGIPVSRVLLLFFIGTLRCAVTLAVRLGLYPLCLVFLTGWIATRAARVRRHQARADVWRFALCAALTLAASVAVACGPASALPDIFAPAPLRGLTLLNPLA